MCIWIRPPESPGANYTDEGMKTAIWSTCLQCVFFCPIRFQSSSIAAPTPRLLLFLSSIVSGWHETDTPLCVYIYYTYIKVDKRGRGELQILFVVTGWSEWRNETAVFLSLYAKWRKTFYVYRFKIAVQIILEISENQLKVRRTWLRYFVCISTPYFYSEEFKFLICRPTGYDLWSIVVSLEIFGVKETHHNIDYKISKLKKKPT